MIVRKKNKKHLIRHHRKSSLPISSQRGYGKMRPVSIWCLRIRLLPAQGWNEAVLWGAYRLPRFNWSTTRKRLSATAIDSTKKTAWNNTERYQRSLVLNTKYNMHARTDSPHIHSNKNSKRCIGGRRAAMNFLLSLFLHTNYNMHARADSLNLLE